MLILLAWQTLLPCMILWRSEHLQVYADKRTRRWLEGLIEMRKEKEETKCRYNLIKL
jgi:hypothetical protein